MFGLMRNFYKWYTTRNEKIVKFALIGIDNAGKSTILARIKGEVPEFITPTIGFASETIDEGPYHISIFDLGGGTNIRSIWPSYFAEVHGSIFVIDSADKNRLNVARDALHAALTHARLQKKPLLILANKQDLPEAMNGSDIALQLSLEKFEDFSYTNVVACSAVLVGEGGGADINIKQGLKWLLDTVSKNFSVLEKRIKAQVDEQKEEERIEKEEKRKRIEAMRRERELEREKQEQEEKEREKEKENTATDPPKEGAELHTPMPEDQGIGMAKEDLKPSASPRRPPTARSYPSPHPSFRMSPRHTATVAPLPQVIPSETPPVEVLTTTPRSAWGTADGRDSRRKLEPITLPSPSLQSL